MPGKRRRGRRAVSAAPLVAAALALTSSTVAAEPPARQQEAQDAELPTPVPQVSEQAIEAPASVSPSNGRRGLGLSATGDTKQVVASSSTTGIPAPALAAYQRAESVINRADSSCNLQWQLVAAIGRVESDHGRAQGNRFDANGVAAPGIFGIALTGKRNTAAIRDTDAGRFDNDPVWDRAVGPMQFIPGTWAAVGVDGDGDGLRDPQDVDDAALATAVYLCSGSDDLVTREGQRAAVYRYNHSRSYVNLVVELMKAYVEGDYSQLPTSTLAAGSLSLTSSGPLVPVRGARALAADGSSGLAYRGTFPFEATEPDADGQDTFAAEPTTEKRTKKQKQPAATDPTTTGAAPDPTSTPETGDEETLPTETGTPTDGTDPSSPAVPDQREDTSTPGEQVDEPTEECPVTEEEQLPGTELPEECLLAGEELPDEVPAERLGTEEAVLPKN